MTTMTKCACLTTPPFYLGRLFSTSPIAELFHLCFLNPENEPIQFCSPKRRMWTGGYRRGPRSLASFRFLRIRYSISLRFFHGVTQNTAFLMASPGTRPTASKRSRSRFRPRMTAVKSPTHTPLSSASLESPCAFPKTTYAKHKFIQWLFYTQYSHEPTSHPGSYEFPELSQRGFERFEGHGQTTIHVVEGHVEERKLFVRETYSTIKGGGVESHST